MNGAILNLSPDAKGNMQLVLKGEWTKEVEHALRNLNWEKLTLWGVEWPNYVNLASHSNKIKWLTVAVGPESNIGLNQLLEINRLEMSDMMKEKFDFRVLPKLHDLEIVWDKKWGQDCLSNSSLKSLVVTGVGGTDLSWLEPMSNLTLLHLLKGSQVSLEGVRYASQLRELKLFRKSKLTDISDLASCGKLEVLLTEGLKSLTKIDAIRELPNLKNIELDAPNATISDIKWVAAMPQLRRLLLTSTVETIDWSVLGKHRSLNWIGISTHVGFDASDDAIRGVILAGGRKIKSFLRMKSKIPSFVIELL